MKKIEVVKRGLRLNETDKKVLLAYSNIVIDSAPKPAIQNAVPKTAMKV